MRIQAGPCAFLFPLCFALLLWQACHLLAQEQSSSRTKAQLHLDKALLALSKLDIRETKKQLELAYNPALPYSAKALTIRAMLALAQGSLKTSQESFLQLFLSYPKPRKDRLAYVIAHSFLENAEYQKAAAYFWHAWRYAAKPAKSDSLSKVKAIADQKRLQELLAKVSLSPLHCPARGQDLSSLYEQEPAISKKKGQHYLALWYFLSEAQALPAREAALAAYFAYSYLADTGQGKEKKRSLLRYLQELPLLSSISPPLLALLRNPNKPAHHTRCISRLRQSIALAERTYKQAHVHRARSFLAFAHKYLERALENAMFLLRDIKSAYDYGLYLEQNARYRKALHVLRISLQHFARSIPLLQEQMELTAFRAYGLALEEILLSLARVYKALGSISDAESIKAMVSHNSAYVHHPHKTKSNLRLWQRSFLGLCHSHMYNREALLLLVHSTEQGRDKNKRAFYQKKLHERDLKMADKELAGAFSYLLESF